MGGFAMTSTMTAANLRSSQKFYADMTQFKERKDLKVERMRQTLTRE